MVEHILIIDDEPNILTSFSSLLKDEGYHCTTSATAEDALVHIIKTGFDLILLDLNLPGLSGLDFLNQVRNDPAAPVTLVISGQSEISTALEAVKLGAVDYLEKPVKPEKLISAVHASLLLSEMRRQQMVMVNEIDDKSKIIGESPTIKKMLATIAQAAPADVNVLISGENGTGKELVATRLFLQSNRRTKPFIKANCPGIPATLFESELFGHVKGAFTGAVKDYSGKFIMADQGTLFLDEIGDLPFECQAKLLRVLETGEVERLGDVAPRLVDVRLICATNRNLPELISQGKFREDLFYRISVFSIEVPPLRQRLSDVPLLVGEFFKRYDPGQRCKLSPNALAYLTTLDYPGNIRQLKNIIERLTITHLNKTIELKDISNIILTGQENFNNISDSLTLAERLHNFERSLISKALDESDGNIAEAARMLKIDRANLSRKVKEFGLKSS